MTRSNNKVEAESSIQQRPHLDWVDVLRIIACLLVIMQHCSDPFYMSFNNEDPNFRDGTLMSSISRPCVPLFVMITGLLLIPVKTDVRTFYRKRIGRVLLPLACWSIVLPWIDFVWLSNLWNTTSPCIEMSDYTLTPTLRKCYTWIFNFNYSTTPFWYLYMLIGLYIMLPVLSGWARNASRRDLQMVLGAWVASSFLPYLRYLAPMLGYHGNFGNMGLFGECDWTLYGSLYYVSGFAGYLLLGYYLHRYPLQWSMKRTLVVFVPLYLIGFSVSWGGYMLMNKLYPGQFRYLEMVWWTCGINVLLQTISVFVIVQRWLYGRALSVRVHQIAAVTFGVYLCHFPVQQIIFDLGTAYLPEQMPTIIRILLNIIITFIATGLLVRMMMGWRITRKLVS